MQKQIKDPLQKMNIKTHTIHEIKIAEVISTEIVIGNIQDGIDLLGNLYYQDYDKIILYKKNITTEFFDLKTGIAGEILQKFSNFRVKLAIVGDFSGLNGDSIQQFMLESNQTGSIYFLNTIEEALKRLSVKE